MVQAVEITCIFVLLPYIRAGVFFLLPFCYSYLFVIHSRPLKTRDVKGEKMECFKIAFWIFVGMAFQSFLFFLAPKIRRKKFTQADWIITGVIETFLAVVIIAVYLLTRS